MKLQISFYITLHMPIMQRGVSVNMNEKRKRSGVKTLPAPQPPHSVGNGPSKFWKHRQVEDDL